VKTADAEVVDRVIVGTTTMVELERTGETTAVEVGGITISVVEVGATAGTTTEVVEVVEVVEMVVVAGVAGVGDSQDLQTTTVVSAALVTVIVPVTVSVVG